MPQAMHLFELTYGKPWAEASAEEQREWLRVLGRLGTFYRGQCCQQLEAMADLLERTGGAQELICGLRSAAHAVFQPPIEGV